MIRKEIVYTVLSLILALVAVAIGFQVPQNGKMDMKYVALGPSENMPSRVANPISFLLPALTGLIFATMVYVAAKRGRSERVQHGYSE